MGTGSHWRFTWRLPRDLTSNEGTLEGTERLGWSVTLGIHPLEVENNLMQKHVPFCREYPNADEMRWTSPLTDKVNNDTWYAV